MTITGSVTGTTNLKIGKVIGKNDFDDSSFTGENISINRTGEQKIWTVGDIDSLDTVYVDGTDGTDEYNGNANHHFKTLKTAYYYLSSSAENPQIVICGDTTITKWPENAVKTATITSKDENNDYDANFTIDASTGKLLLLENTTFSDINIMLSNKTTNIDANQNSISFTSNVSIKDGENYLTVSGIAGENNIASGSFKSITAANVATTINVTNTVDRIGSINTANEGDKNCELTVNTYSGAKIDNINDETNKKINRISIDIKCTNNDAETTNINENEINTNIYKEENDDVFVTLSTTETNQVEVTLKRPIISNTLLIGSNVKLNIEAAENIKQIQAAYVNLKEEAGLKVNDNLTLIGTFVGNGNLYLNNGIEFFIDGTVSGTKSVFNQDGGQVCTAIIKATSTPSGDKQFKIGGTEQYWSKDETTTGNYKAVWTIKYEIENIYISSSGSDKMIGSDKASAVKTLYRAYYLIDMFSNGSKPCNIILLSNIDVSEENLGTTKNINVTITSETTDDENKYYLRIKKQQVNFTSNTILQNIGIDTTGVTSSVEFFANGHDVEFGNYIEITSNSGLYPILYGGTRYSEIGYTNLTVLSGTYNMIFGGSYNGNITGTVNLTIGSETQQLNVTGYGSESDGKTGVFGGNREGGNINGAITLDIYNGTFHRIYGAGIRGRVNNDVTVNYYKGTTNRLYGAGQGLDSDNDGSAAEVTGMITVNIGSETGEALVKNYLRGSGQYSKANKTIIRLFNGAKISDKESTNIDKKVQVAAGGYRGNVEESTLEVYPGATVECDIYGGGWGTDVSTEYGCSTNAEVIIYKGATVTGNVYGGGCYGTTTNTTVKIGQVQEQTTGETTTVTKNVYGGGKGVSGGEGTVAVVNGNTTVIIDGDTTIGTEETKDDLNYGNVFGGGNSANSGSVGNEVSTNVYIAGGTIYGDVYGGANTAIVYGKTNIKIGQQAIRSQEYNYQAINIKGSVFGGGKSNKAGSQNYDFSYPSVQKNVSDDDKECTNINIDGTNLTIEDSIFASGNAATIIGEGNINIFNYGTTGTTTKELLSIQRATTVTIDNSNIRIKGKTDRSNEVSTEEYTLNRINTFTLKNNSELYLDYGVNFVKDLYSEDSRGNSITNQENQVTNKLFIQEGKNIILRDELYNNGSVNGMIFLGKYKIEGDGFNTGIYGGNPGIENETFTKISYVQAQVYEQEEGNQKFFYRTGENKEERFITPNTSERYSQWMLIDDTKSKRVFYEKTLVASKYSSYSQAVIEISELQNENASFTIVDGETGETTSINKNYKEDGTTFQEINLKKPSDITNISEKANSDFALKMYSGEQGWSSRYETAFIDSQEDADTNSWLMGGTNDTTITYTSDASSGKVPSLIFDFIHSKNITESNDLGTATIVLRVDDGSQEQELIYAIIKLNLLTIVDSSDIVYYEGAIAPGEKYDVFSSVPTNITANSDFSVYFSLYLDNEKATQYNDYLTRRDGYTTERSLVMDNPLPKGTKMVLIDKSKGTNNYYYYVVSEEDTAKKTFNFNEFIAMGTDGTILYSYDTNYYNDNNSKDDTSDDYVLEEFIIQTSFADVSFQADTYTNSMKIRLTNDKGTVSYVSDDYIIENNEDLYEILLAEEDGTSEDDTYNTELNDELYKTKYTVYKDRNVVSNIYLSDIEGNKKDDETLYIPLNEIESTQTVNLQATYNYAVDRGNIIYDTTNFYNAEGLKI